MKIATLTKAIKSVAAIGTMLLISNATPAEAYTETAFLKRCDIRSTSRGTIWIGIYELRRGEYYSYWFESYCPSSIQIEVLY
ncbi:hypothetical protein IQ231_04525 [Cuspidothrix issatschenkoi LEGE 03284]|nr:hypothetical protein [Cuspidothrix issatschenkoi LEGE 03284]